MTIRENTNQKINSYVNWTEIIEISLNIRHPLKGSPYKRQFKTTLTFHLHFLQPRLPLHLHPLEKLL